MAKASKATQEPPQASPEPSPYRHPPRSNGRHPGGRPYEKPTAYNEKAIEAFFSRLAAGMKVKEAADDPDCPHHVAIYHRSALEPEFFNRFLRAREAQQEALVDNTLEIADEATSENWQVARLRIQAIQWRAARLASKIYGEKSQLNLVVSDALSDRLTAAIKRQKELMGASVPLLEGVAETVEPAIVVDPVEPAAVASKVRKTRP